jgi:hypothetical protein
MGHRWDTDTQMGQRGSTVAMQRKHWLNTADTGLSQAGEKLGPLYVSTAHLLLARA